MVPSASTPQAAGIAATDAVIRAVSWPIRVAEGGLVQQQLGELAVVVIEHAGQGLNEVVVLSLHPGAGQVGQRLLATLDSLIKAPSSSFSSRWKQRVRSWASRVRVRV